METCALVSSGRRHCLLLTEVVQVSFLLPYLCSSGQGKLMSEWLFGTRPERGLFLECLLQGALAWKEVAEVPGRSPGSEIWFGCRVTLVAPVSRNKCSVTGQRTQVMPSLWDSFEELAGCWDCQRALALTSLGVSLHDCSQEGSRETRSCCCDLARPHGQ